MKTPLIEDHKTYKCPLCGGEFSINKIFLTQEPKSTPKPIACTRCIEGLYWSIPDKDIELIKKGVRK